MKLKAKRNYKESIKQVQSQEEKNNTQRRKQSEIEDKQHMKQRKEFEAFLKEAVAKPKPFQFLVDMHTKLIVDGDLLSENMMNAIRKCMKREEDWKKKKKASEAGNYPTITLKIKPFLMKSLGIDSRIITGKVKAESGKAWLIEGYADMLENVSYCVRCMRQLTEPASQITGMGSTCAEKAGVPYDPSNVLGASKKARENIRKQFVKKLNNQKFETWIPKSQSEVVENSK